ncbi:MAG: glycerate kinase [Bacillota bacterium]|nr:glycerate kinase [Bacillota bacterium]
MKIIIIPDSFKGTLTSLEVCNTIENALKGHEVTSIPVADGGEGTLDAFSHAKAGTPFSKAEIVSAPSKDAWGNDMDAPYLLAGKLAVIEMAKVAGFTRDNKSDEGNDSLVMSGTTYGVGMLINDAISRGARKIVLGLGGNCTNDGGCGMAAAMGVKFLDETGKSFIPAGGTLSQIALVDNTAAISVLAEDASLFHSKIDIVGMCDVNNPLLGSKGAASVFAPQKGASPREVDILESGLENLVSQISDGVVNRTVSGFDAAPTLSGGWAEKLADLPGSGAAGGMGYGLRALLAGRLESGIDLLLDEIDFEELLFDADLVITGEGNFDFQSLRGKAVSGICRRAKAADVPVILVAGSIRADADQLKQLGVIRSFETGELDFDQPIEEIKKAAFANLEKTAHELADFL